MKEWLNPFDILGATPRDDRRRLTMLAQDAALLVDEKEAQAAYTALINPETRLKAEVRWTEGHKHGLYEAFTALAKTLRKTDVQRAAGLIAELCEDCEGVHAEALMLKINENRTAADFRPAKTGEVQEALNDSIRGLAQLIAQNLRSDVQLGQMILMLVEANPKLAFSPLLQMLAAEYEIRTAAKAEEEREKIAAQILKVNAGGRMNIAWEMDRLCRRVVRWNQLVLPLRKLRAARELPHEPSVSCFWAARTTLDMPLKLLNAKLSWKLICTLRDCFSDIEKLKETIGKDCETIGELYEKQKRLAQKNHKEIKRILPFLLVLLVFYLLASPDDLRKKVVVTLIMALILPLIWVLNRSNIKHIE